MTVVADTIPEARRSVEGDSMSQAAAVTMVEPIAGFESDTDYLLSPIDEAGYLASLRSVRDPELRFVLSPAEIFFADYGRTLTQIVTAPVADALGTEPDANAQQILVILTIGSSLKDTTANLRAPLVVDRATGRAIQVILEDDSFPLRAPLPAE